MKLFLAFLSCCFVLAQCDDWRHLRTTFGLIGGTGAFYPEPLTAEEREEDGWEYQLSSCDDRDAK